VGRQGARWNDVWPFRNLLPDENDAQHLAQAKLGGIDHVLTLDSGPSSGTRRNCATASGYLSSSRPNSSRGSSSS